MSKHSQNRPSIQWYIQSVPYVPAAVFVLNNSVDLKFSQLLLDLFKMPASTGSYSLTPAKNHCFSFGFALDFGCFCQDFLFLVLKEAISNWYLVPVSVPLRTLQCHHHIPSSALFLTMCDNSLWKSDMMLFRLITCLGLFFLWGEETKTTYVFEKMLNELCWCCSVCPFILYVSHRNSQQLVCSFQCWMPLFLLLLSAKLIS